MRHTTTIAIAALSCVLLISGCSTTTYTYTCAECEQHWRRETTRVGPVPVRSDHGEHEASDHVAQYNGGGYFVDTRFLGQASSKCGRHTQTSGISP